MSQLEEAQTQLEEAHYMSELEEEQTQLEEAHYIPH
jgi:hypothetical protein